jgi:hypothetical protein
VNKLVINVSKAKYMIFRMKNRAVNMHNKNISIDFTAMTITVFTVRKKMLYYLVFIIMQTVTVKHINYKEYYLMSF